MTLENHAPALVLLTGALVVLCIYWPVATQIRTDLQTLPRLTQKHKQVMVQFPFGALRAYLAPGMTIMETYRLDRQVETIQGAPLSPPPGFLVRQPFVIAELVDDLAASATFEPIKTRMPRVNAQNCLFDRTRDPLVIRVSQKSQFTHAHARVALGPAGVTIQENNWISEGVCNTLLQPFVSEAVPFVSPKGDFLDCKRRLAVKGLTWAGFYCQVARNLLWALCPAYEDVSESRYKCPKGPDIPTAVPTCCTRIFFESNFFTVTNPDGSTLALLQNDTVEVVQNNTHPDILTQTFSLTSGYAGNNITKERRNIRAGLIPIFLAARNSGTVFTTGNVSTDVQGNATNLAFFDGRNTFDHKNASECLVTDGVIIGAIPNEELSLHVPNALLRCVDDDPFKDATHVCLTVENDIVRPVYTPAPCEQRPFTRFILEPGSGRVMVGTDHVCLRKGGLAVLPRCGETEAAVFMYTNQKDQNQGVVDHTQVPITTFLAYAKPLETDLLFDIGRWVISPSTRTVFLERQNVTFDSSTEFEHTIIQRETNESTPAFPGTIGWAMNNLATIELGENTANFSIPRTNSPVGGNFHAPTRTPPSMRAFPERVSFGLYRYPCMTSMVDCGGFTEEGPSPFSSGIKPIQVPEINLDRMPPPVPADAKKYPESTGVLYDLCASDLTHQRFRLFFDSKACASSVLNECWKKYRQNTVGLCAQGFDGVRIQSEFGCRGYRISEKRSDPTRPYMKLTFYDSAFVDTGCNEKVTFEVSHAPLNKSQYTCFTQPADMAIPGSGPFYKNYTKNFTISRQTYLTAFCSAWRSRGPRNSLGWAGSQAVAEGVCVDHGGAGNPRSSLLLGGSISTDHQWSNAGPGSSGLETISRCLEFTCPMTNNFTVHYGPNERFFQTIRPLWNLGTRKEFQKSCENLQDSCTDIPSYLKPFVKTLNRYSYVRPILMEFRAKRQIMDPKRNITLYHQHQIVHRVNMTGTYMLLLYTDIFQDYLQLFPFWKANQTTDHLVKLATEVSKEDEEDFLAAYADNGAYNDFRILLKSVDSSAKYKTALTPLITDFLFDKDGPACRNAFEAMWNKRMAKVQYGAFIGPNMFTFDPSIYEPTDTIDTRDDALVLENCPQAVGVKIKMTGPLGNIPAAFQNDDNIGIRIIIATDKFAL